MYVIRGDCPLEMMADLLYAETVYAIVQFLHCNICSKTIQWGVCIRGAPIYKAVEKDVVDRWPWDNKSEHWLK